MALCSIKNLSKTYPAFELSDISFELKPGRITGFIGRNGAGKTTAIKSVLGLVHPDCGEVHFFSLPFSKNERQIKQRIGFSTGSVNYYHKKKIKNIVSVTKSFYQNWDEEAYKEYLNLFALDENKAPYELSEGMKVKFNLLLALSHRAEVLILDEPTSGLIYRTEKQGRCHTVFHPHHLRHRKMCRRYFVYPKRKDSFTLLQGCISQKSLRRRRNHRRKHTANGKRE